MLLLRTSFLALPAAIALAVGCSPAPDPIAQGQAKYQVKQPTTTPVGKSCGQSATAGIGATKPLRPGDPIGEPDLPPPLPNEPKNPGGPVINGQSDYTVLCTLSGSDTINVDLQLEGLDTIKGVGATNIKVVGEIDAKKGEGTGNVSFFTTDVFNVSPASGEECTLHIVRDLSTSESALQLDMKRGKIWLTFQCPGVTLSSNDQRYCASEGTVVMSNCAVR